jgi:hypothetical protein
MKQLKYVALAGALAFSSIFLSGCEQENPEETAKDEADIDANTRAAMNQDEVELKQELAKAQAKDPSIKDMYYGVDDEGNKVLNVIREVKDPATGAMQAQQTSSMMNGMVLGMLMGHMMSNNFNGGGMMNRSYPMSESRNYRNQATSRYSGYSRTVQARSYVSSRPSSAYSTRSAGALSSSSSARSGGYSAGG